MEEYEYHVRIPKNRIGVLIGTDGETKGELEELTGVNIDVDSKDGGVTLSGEDTLELFKMQDVVKAIGRGFNPKLAQLLLKQDYVLEIIKITDFVKDKKNHINRARGRVIGKEGKAREMIESQTETYVSVYGKTVSIIGTVERVQIAATAIESLLDGSPHGPVYESLQKAMKALKKRELLT